MKILLTEGSGLTARQVAGLLHGAGHRVAVASSDPLCLCRFTSAVGKVHAVPAYGAEPLRWLDACIEVYARGRYDLLFPTQEQVAVLSKHRQRLKAAGVATVVPSFEALAAVQDKVSAAATLARLGVPQPPTTVVRSEAELLAWAEFPVFAKAPIGTASSAVRKLSSRADSAALVSDWRPTDPWADGGVVLQKTVVGPLAMLQAVFDQGRLVAFHANLRVREGARGGASHKRSVDLPEAREALDSLGGGLRWHGALSADAILGPDGPLIIDVNPRLVEPMNAFRSGVDLVGAMVALGEGRAPPVQHAGRTDIATHQLLLAVLGAAEHGAGRRGVAAECWQAWKGARDYRGSLEELTPPGDVAQDLPLIAAAAATLVRPGAWRWFASGSVGHYALSPAGWRSILASSGP